MPIILLKLPLNDEQQINQQCQQQRKFLQQHGKTPQHLQSQQVAAPQNSQPVQFRQFGQQSVALNQPLPHRSQCATLPQSQRN